MPSGSRIVLRTAAVADVPTPDTDQSALFMNADDANAPYWMDDGGTEHALEGATGAAASPLGYNNHGSTGSTETVDASVADVQRLVANAATVTLTITNPPASGTPGIIRLWLEQDGSGGRDWAFPGSVEFGDPGEPDWTTRTGGAVDLVDLMTVDGGTVWIATVAGQPGPQGPPGDDGADGTAQVATDPIWDAAGDLAQGTGANTSAKLSAGTAGFVLKSAGAAAAVVWAAPGEFVTAGAKIATSENTTSGSFADLATPGPSATVTIGASGKAKVCISARCSNTNANVDCYVGVDISGASTVAAGTLILTNTPAGEPIQFGTSTLITGLTPGSTTFKMQYATAANTASFSVREIIVEPVI